jgi:hypothetical protein
MPSESLRVALMSRRLVRPSDGLGLSFPQTKPKAKWKLYDEHKSQADPSPDERYEWACRFETDDASP